MSSMTWSLGWVFRQSRGSKDPGSQGCELLGPLRCLENLLSGEEGGRIQNSGLLGTHDRHPDEGRYGILVLSLVSRYQIWDFSNPFKLQVPDVPKFGF